MKPPKRKTPLTNLKEIERLGRELDERIAQLEDDAVHVPRREPLPKGHARTIFNHCDENCPACVQGKEYAMLQIRLGELRRQALEESVRLQLDTKPATKKRQAKVVKRHDWLREQIDTMNLDADEINGSRDYRRSLLDEYKKKFGLTGQTFSKDLQAIGLKPR